MRRCKSAWGDVGRQQDDAHAPRSGGPKRQRRMAEVAAILLRDAKAVIWSMNLVVDENRRRKIAGRSHWRPGPLAVRSSSRRPRSRRFRHWAGPDRLVDVDRSRSRLYDDTGRRQQESGNVLRYKLNPQCCAESIEAEDVQIFVEVAQPRRQRDRFNASSFRAASNCLHRISGGIVVASDVEPAQVRGEQHGREVVGRVSKPSPASTSCATPNRTALPSRKPIARRGVSITALPQP